MPKNDRASAGSSVAQFESIRESTRPKNPKRPRHEKTPDNSQFLMKVIEDTNQFISSASKIEEPDEDDLYGQSIGKELKKLSAYQKSLTKLRIQQVLHEVRWSNLGNLVAWCGNLIILINFHSNSTFPLYQSLLTNH